MQDTVDQMIKKGHTFGEITDHIRREVVAEGRKQGYALTDGALNNAGGNWHESIMEVSFMEGLQEVNAASGQHFVAIRMPMSGARNQGDSYSRFLDLFRPEAYQPGGRLEWFADKLEHTYFPSPDLVLVRIDDPEVVKRLNAVAERDAEADNYRVYRLLGGTLQADQVMGTVSLKTSTRPDRRYQAMYEAEMVKSISRRAGLSWKTGFITSTMHHPVDLAIYENGIGIAAITSGDSTLRYADMWRHHERQPGLTTWLRQFLGV